MYLVSRQRILYGLEYGVQGPDLGHANARSVEQRPCVPEGAVPPPMARSARCVALAAAASGLLGGLRHTSWLVSTPQADNTCAPQANPPCDVLHLAKQCLDLCTACELLLPSRLSRLRACTATLQALIDVHKHAQRRQRQLNAKAAHTPRGSSAACAYSYACARMTATACDRFIDGCVRPVGMEHRCEQMRSSSSVNPDSSLPNTSATCGPSLAGPRSVASTAGLPRARAEKLLATGRVVPCRLVSATAAVTSASASCAAQRVREHTNAPDATAAWKRFHQLLSLCAPAGSHAPAWCPQWQSHRPPAGTPQHRRRIAGPQRLGQSTQSSHRPVRLLPRCWRAWAGLGPP